MEGGDRSRLRPFPRPPVSAPERPWKVFLELAACEVVPYDVEAPCLDLSDKPGEWTERDLESLLSRLNGLFVDAPPMDYVIDFLNTCAGPPSVYRARAVQVSLCTEARPVGGRGRGRGPAPRGGQGGPPRRLPALGETA